MSITFSKDFPSRIHTGQWQVSDENAGVTAFVHAYVRNYNGESMDILFNGINSSNSGADWGIGLASVDRVVTRLRVNDATQQIAVYAGLPLYKQNVFMALSYNGSEYFAWVNGVKVATQAVSGPLSDQGGQVHIGRSIGNDAPFDGDIHHARVYNRGLSVEELNEIMYAQCQDLHADTSLEAEWHFNELVPGTDVPNNDDVLKDHSGNERHGTAVDSTYLPTYTHSKYYVNRRSTTLATANEIK